MLYAGLPETFRMDYCFQVNILFTSYSVGKSLKNLVQLTDIKL